MGEHLEVFSWLLCQVQRAWCLKHSLQYFSVPIFVAIITELACLLPPTPIYLLLRFSSVI